jgi:hypothetical protein
MERSEDEQQSCVEMTTSMKFVMLFLFLGFVVSIYKLLGQPKCTLLGESNMLLKFIAWWIFWPIMLLCDNNQASLVRLAYD